MGLSKFPGMRQLKLCFMTDLAPPVYSHLRKTNSLMGLNYAPVAIE